MTYIAGHLFTGSPETCVCGKAWLDLVRDRDLWVVGAAGVAHSGMLMGAEVVQLNEKLEAAWRAMMEIAV